MKKNLLKALSLCITLCMMLTTVLMTSVSAWTEGSGELPDDFTCLFDYRIRDTNIFYVPAKDKLSGDTIEGGDMYYMVGTTEGKYGSEDYWSSNEGIRMWKSKDMVTWESVFGDGNEDNYSEDAEDQNDNPDNYVWKKKDSSWANNRGPVWAPEIHYIFDTDTLEGNYYMTYSMGGSAPGSTCQVTQGDHMSDPLNFECQHNGNGLLRSTTGRPEGPYEEVKDGPIVCPWIDGALFQDVENGGTVYYIWQNGQIAQMNDTMTDILPETYAHLKTTNNSTVNQQVGFEGASVVYYEGKYYLYAADNNADLGKFYTYDCMVASSDNLFGPYSERYLAIRHGGHNNFFVNREGELWSTFFGNPQAAIQPPFTARPGALEMTLDSQGMLTPKLDVQPARRIDLAKGKEVKASSGENSAKYAVDNDQGTIWYANDNEKSWLVVDLGGVYNLTGMKLFSQSETAQYYYSIETATDSAAWETPDNADLWSSYIDHMESGTVGLYSEDASAAARYVKISFDDTDNKLSGYVGSIRDFEVYGLPIGDNAKEIAQYVALSNVASGEISLKMPLMPDGYTVSIKETDRPDVIAKDGKITPVALETIVNVTLTITNTKNASDKADTKAIAVKVAPDSSASLIESAVLDASSNNGRTSLILLNNGTASPAWTAETSGKNDAEWVQIDLQRPYNLSEAIIFFDNPENGYSYKVEYSKYGKTWTAFGAAGTSESGKTQVSVKNSEAVYAQYIRVTVDDAKTDKPLALQEIRVIGDEAPIPGTNIALNLGKDAYSASEEHDSGGYNAEVAFDGDMTTRWAPKSNAKPQWLMVDLGKVETINALRMFAEFDDRYSQYYVEVATEEDGEWTMVADRQETTLIPGTYGYIDLVDSVEARYVRLTFTGNEGGGDWASIWEFEVYSGEETVAPPVTSTPDTSSSTTSQPSDDGQNTGGDGNDGIGVVGVVVLIVVIVVVVAAAVVVVLFLLKKKKDAEVSADEEVAADVEAEAEAEAEADTDNDTNTDAE